MFVQLKGLNIIWTTLYITLHSFVALRKVLKYVYVKEVLKAKVSQKLYKQKFSLLSLLKKLNWIPS